jgi:hypothetical protein
MLGRRAREEGCAWVCRARVAVRREVRAVAGKRGLPRGRAPGFMCNEAAEFARTSTSKASSALVSCYTTLVDIGWDLRDQMGDVRGLTMVGSVKITRLHGKQRCVSAKKRPE